MVAVLEGRACDGCNVCCVALTIRDRALQKAQGVRCGHATAEDLCAIYDRRPEPCRGFECGWRQLRWVRPALRPDRSGVLIRLRRVGEGAGIVLTILRPAGLEAEGLAETVAAAVQAGVPVALEVAGRPGWTYGIAEINGVLAGAVLARDKPGLLALLRAAYAQGQVGPSREVLVN